MIRSRKNSGFVLVLVLAVLVIASVVLSGWAYRSGRKALLAGEVSRDVQRKWGNLSCQKLLLSAADELLDKESADSDEPVVSFAKEIQLSGMTYHLVLSDEQAKANINSLFKNTDRQYVVELIGRLISGNENHPTIREKIAGVQTNCSSFDQIFDYEDPAQLLGLTRVTCWGSGLVNYKRAEEDTLTEVTSGILSNTDIQKLLELRQEDFEGGLDELCKKLTLRDEQAKPLEKILTAGSNCKSLWIECRDDTRSWYRLYIENRSPNQKDSVTLVYQW